MTIGYKARLPARQAFSVPDNSNLIFQDLTPCLWPLVFGRGLTFVPGDIATRIQTITA